MSRTKHHRDKRVDCKEYWSRRPLSNAGGAARGRSTKVTTHRRERRRARQEVVELFWEQFEAEKGLADMEWLWRCAQHREEE